MIDRLKKTKPHTIIYVPVLIIHQIFSLWSPSQNWEISEWYSQTFETARCSCSVIVRVRVVWSWNWLVSLAIMVLAERRARCEKHLKCNKHNSSTWRGNNFYALIFFLGYYLFLEAHSFPRATLSGCFSEQMLCIKYFRSRAIGLKASRDRI